MLEVKHAEDLFSEFKAQSVSEFFRKNAAMLGYTGKLRSMTTVIHEGVTNSLDACEEAGILPDILVDIEELGDSHYRISVEDNASGIPLKFIPEVFGKMLAGSKAHRNIQSRGQQGIGISGAVMFSQITTGKPSKIITSTGDDYIVICDVQIDVENNIGKIVDKIRIPNEDNWRGTKILMEVKDVMYNRSKYSPYHYLKMTSISNPHSRITLIEPDRSVIFFDRSVQYVPKSPKEIKPHPYGIKPDDLLRMARYADKKKISSFLLSDFVRISKNRLKEIEKFSGVDLGKSCSKLTWNDAERIVDSFKKIKFMAPPTDGLIPIEEEAIKKSFETTLTPEFIHTITRPPLTYKGGIPFIVEVGIAYGGKAGNGGLEIIRYANRAPLVFDAGGCAITEAVSSIDWKRYGVAIDRNPVTVLVNLISTHIPYTSAGKQAIAREEEIYNEIRNAVMDAARNLKVFLSRKRRAYERKKKIDTLSAYVPETSKGLAKLLKLKSDDKIRKAFYKIIEKTYGDVNGYQD